MTLNQLVVYSVSKCKEAGVSVSPSWDLAMDKSRASVGLKRLFVLVLFGFLIRNLYLVCFPINCHLLKTHTSSDFFSLKAAEKFFDGQLGTVIEYNSSISEIQAPSVSVCPYEKKWLSGTKVNTYTLKQLTLLLKSFLYNSLITLWRNSLLTHHIRISSKHSTLLPGQILAIQSYCEFSYI